MSVKRAVLLFAGLVVLATASVGLASAAGAGVDDATALQVDQNGTEYPVEPPTDSLPEYEEIRQEGDTDAKIQLGKQLFLDPRISEDGSISCNSCHNVMEGGDDGRPTAVGVHGQTGPVNSPTVWNSAFYSTQFWDGRADTLAEQAEGPIVADVEMGMPDHEAALDRIRNNEGYTEQFEEVYGDEMEYDEPADLVTIETVTDAIAAYERTLITPNSSYDRYVEGDTDAMTEQQIDGMETFQELGCQSCHSGPALSGQGPGTSYAAESGDFYGQKFPMMPENEQCQEYVEEYNLNEGDGRMAVSDDEADENVYKVPTLRNVEHTAPYMHTGTVTDLDTAIEIMASCQLGQDVSDQEVEDMRAFMTALTGEYPEQSMPRLPEPSGQSMLPYDSNRDLTDVEGEPSLDSEGGDGEGDGEAADGGSTDGESADDEATPTQASEDGPGFGFGAALVAAALVVSAALIAARRRAN